MTERGILFSAPMVRALLDGTKTQTRRVVTMPPSWDCIVYADWGNGLWPYRSDDGESPNYDNNEIPLACPYGQPGDCLWVRETFCLDDNGHEEWPIFRADGVELPTRPATRKPARWTPSIHMPRAVSRILLEITSVRAERLQDISEANADAEGCERLDYERYERDPALCPKCDGLRLHRALGPNGGVIEDVDCVECDTYVKRYRHLWESINGAGSWDANPWVWVVEFKRVRP